MTLGSPHATQQHTICLTSCMEPVGYGVVDIFPHLCPEAVHFMPYQGIHADDAPATLAIHQAGLPIWLRAAFLRALL